MNASFGQPRALTVAAATAAVATLLGLIALWPSNLALPDLGFLGVASAVYQAEVTSTDLGPCEGSAPEDGRLCHKVAFHKVVITDVYQHDQEKVLVRRALFLGR